MGKTRFREVRLFFVVVASRRTSILQFVKFLLFSVGKIPGSFH